MELMRIDSLLFKALYVVEAGIVVTQVLNMDTLTSLLFFLTFPITVLLWLRSVRRTVKETDIVMCVTIAMAIISVFINASLCAGHIGFQYLRKLIMFIMTLLFFQAAHRTKADRKMITFVNGTVDTLAAVLIVMYFVRWPQMHIVNGQVTTYLSFRFTNPNLTALFLTCLFMLKMNRLFAKGTWYTKVIHWIMVLLLAWFVVQTQSRNCMMVMTLFTALCVWVFFSKKKDLTIRKVWAVLIAVIPGVFVMGYMALVYSPLIQKLLSFMVSEGKGLNSRVEIWKPALENIFKSPIVGAYYQISNGTGSSQMHNNHLDIAASYGLPVLVLVCILLIAYLYQRGRRYREKCQYIYMLGFCCTVLLGIGEAAVFAGGMGIYILAGSFLLLGNAADPEQTVR